MTLIFIMISSGIGAVCRHLTNEIVKKTFNTSFPVATLIVNILGSFMIGIAAQFLQNDTQSYAMIAIGFCGGYTTFSTHFLEIYERYLLKSYKQMVIYLLMTIILSISACLVGYYV
nr:CrcB family protein [Mammaliicoccus sp. Marseille-Q6498]